MMHLQRLVGSALTMVVFMGRLSGADYMDHGYCYCGANFKYINGITLDHPHQPYAEWSFFLQYIHYYSEVHKKHYTHFWKDKDRYGFPGPDNAWSVGSQWYYRFHIEKKFDDGIMMANGRWQYIFNRGRKRTLPGWNQRGDEVKSKNKRKEQITDCTNWCRMGWPHLPDITSMCNQSAPGMQTFYNNMDTVWHQYRNKQDIAKCWLYHYTALTNEE